MSRRREEGRIAGSATEPDGRRRQVTGIVAATAAVVVFGAAPLAVSPSAHADIDVSFDPVIDVVAATANVADPDFSAVDPGAAGPIAALTVPDVPVLGDAVPTLDALLGDWFQTLVFDPIQQIGQLWSASPFGVLLDPLLHWPGLAGPAAGLDAPAYTWLFGDSAAGAATAHAAAAGTAGTTALQSASVPLEMKAMTEPVVDISVNGGPNVPVLVDTGSAGLVLPIWEMGLNQLSFPTSFGMGAYSGGLGYVYLTMPAKVDFGPDLTTGQSIVTDPTSINAVIFAYPTSWQAFLATGGTWNSFFAPAGVDGVLGIGPNAIGPTPNATVISSLPGSLGDGVLIDQAKGILQFGPNPLGADATTVNGAPNAPLAVSINGGPLQHNVPSIIDSGGVFGTMPASLLGSTGGIIPAGTQVSVYTNDGQTLLYSYTVSYYAPTVIGSGAMNTGNYPFAQQPIYISNAGRGATIFGGLSPDVTQP